MTQQMYAGDAVTEMLRTAGGSVPERIQRALRLLIDALDVQMAYVDQSLDGQSAVTYSASTDDTASMPTGTTSVLQKKTSDPVVEPVMSTSTDGFTSEEELGGLPYNPAIDRGLHWATVPLEVGGQTGGMLAVATASASATGLGAHAAAFLNVVAAHIGDLLSTDVAEHRRPDLRQLAAAIAAGNDLESLTRPLMKMAQQITGLESVYLTMADDAAREVVLAYAYNATDLTFTEGTSVAWHDALSLRAIAAGRRYLPDIQTMWPDVPAVQHLGITTFISIPLRDTHSKILGALCATGRTLVDIDERDLDIVDAFAQLITTQLARDLARSADLAHAAALENRLARLREAAESDPLTGLANRAGIRRWLDDTFDQLTDPDMQIAVAIIDLDRFKSINDTHGHGTGDDVLRHFAASLARTGRAGDLHGRLGGDEFIIAARLPKNARVDEWRQRIETAATTTVSDLRVSGSVGVAISAFDDRNVDELLQRADRAMYESKTLRNCKRIDEVDLSDRHRANHSKE